MKPVQLFTAAALLLAVACNNADNKTPAKDTTGNKPATAAKRPTMDEMNKACMEYGTPGTMHAMLAKESGKWNVDITTWMMPDSPAMKATAECEMSFLFDKFQQAVYKSPNFGGMPFEGHGTVAYDNAEKVFVSTWFDNLGTGVMISKGTWDEASKSIAFKGSFTDPITKQLTPFREIWTVVNDNTRKMEMYSTPSWGPEYKWMEMLLTRKK
jgi:hypothetical protein